MDRANRNTALCHAGALLRTAESHGVEVTKLVEEASDRDSSLPGLFRGIQIIPSFH